MIQDFKKFLLQGNVLDLAVAVVIGAAFKAVIDAFVSKLLMPVVAAIFGQPSVGGISITLREFDEPKVINGTEYTKAALEIGSFLDVVIQFVIVALALFVVVKAYEKMQARRKDAAVTEETAESLSVSEELLVEIRDLLSAQGPTTSGPSTPR